MDNTSVHRINDAQIKRLKATQIAFSHPTLHHSSDPWMLGSSRPSSFTTDRASTPTSCTRWKLTSRAIPWRTSPSPWPSCGDPCLVQSEPLDHFQVFSKFGFKGADDTGTAAVTADLSLPELAPGDTEELLWALPRWKTTTYSHPSRRQRTCWSKLLPPSMLRHRGSQDRDSWSRLVWMRRSTNRMMRLRSRSPLPRPSWRLWTPSSCTPWPAGMSMSCPPRSTWTTIRRSWPADG